MSDQPLGSSQPGPLSLTLSPSSLHPFNTALTQSTGDSKSTANKLAEDAKGAGQNVLDTGSHYADKSGATDTANKATEKTGSTAQNVADTAQHYVDKAGEGTSGTTATGGQKTYVEQAQDMAANALNTASKAASGMCSPVLCMCHSTNEAVDLAGSISGEKK